MVVEFSEGFEKELKKHFSKSEAKNVVRKLADTKTTDGDTITTIAGLVLKERKHKVFRFYFVFNATKQLYLTREELEEALIRFIALSKKNNQQQVIDKLKEDLKNFDFSNNNL